MSFFVRSWAAAVLILVAVTAAYCQDRPYKRMMGDELTFTGHAGQLDGLSHDAPICIGGFLPDTDNHPAGQAVIKGILLALEQANTAGGYQGRMFEFKRRWAGSPWGAGSKEMIRLVYEDHAMAVISYLAAATHVAQQTALKSYIPVITPVATDTTLTHARVPWIFRLPPDDEIQAKALVGAYLSGVSAAGPPGLITATDADSRVATRELTLEMNRKGIPPKFHHEIDPAGTDLSPLFNMLADQAAENPVNRVFVRLPHHQMQRFIQGLKRYAIPSHLYIPWIPGLDVPQGLRSTGVHCTVIAPLDHSRSGVRFSQFAAAFQNRYKEEPLPCAAYGYDAAQMVIQAVQQAGPGRAGIRQALAQRKKFQGVTGPITWDTGGGNTSGAPDISIYP
ncbi:MAG: ABC transporter substrate-binding protein [Desulfobacteraceae bacterium]|nr:MAG: ABC transporter substrate-binding protein [Desulfobacteraceae bacterium]